MLTTSDVVKCNFKEDSEIEIGIFVPGNGNTSLMETLFQNRYLFASLQEIDSIKNIIDVMCQNTIEKETTNEASNYGIELDNGDYQIITDRELYLLRQNNNGQNILHLAINAFKQSPNRLLIFNVLVEYLKQYLSYESWEYLCFVQVNRPFVMFVRRNINQNDNIVEYKFFPCEYKLNDGLQLQQAFCPQRVTNGGMTVIQNLYYMRYPIIIGLFDNAHRNYSIRQSCVEALRTYQKWQYSHDMTEEQKLKESRVLRQLVVAQYALQQLCVRSSSPKYRYAITLWTHSSETIRNIVLGETTDIKFNFYGKFSPLNNALNDILSEVFDSAPIEKFDLNQIELDYSFDATRRVSLCISKAVNKHVQRVFTIIRNRTHEKKVEVKQVKQAEQVKQDEPVIDIKIEDEFDAEIEALVNKDKRPQISITQIGGDDQEKIKFHKQLDLDLTFETHCQQVILRGNGDKTQMVNIPQFLMYLIDPSNEMSWADVKAILTNSTVVFALRAWMQEVIDTVKWRIFVPEKYRSICSGMRFIDVNVFGFLIYIGIPLILLTNVLSVNRSSGDDFGKMLCNRTFESHFRLLDRSRFLLHNGPDAPSIAFVMLLMPRKCRNLNVDKLNVEFLAHFAPPRRMEVQTTRRGKAVYPAKKGRIIENPQQEYLRSYIKEDLKCGYVFDSNKYSITVQNIPAELLEEAWANCEKYVKAYNAESSMLKMGMPNKQFVQKAVLDEYIVLYVCQEQIDVSNMLDGKISAQFTILLVEHVPQTKASRE